MWSIQETKAQSTKSEYKKKKFHKMEPSIMKTNTNKKI